VRVFKTRSVVRYCIGVGQLAELKAAADDVLSLTAKQIARRLNDATLSEVPYGEGSEEDDGS
jgi:hypothetical protein